MVKKSIPWKEGKVISIETRKGVFVIAQMLKEPFLRFYKAFKQNENWEDLDLKSVDTLFVNSVLGQFLKESNITEIKNVIPDTEREDTNTWIDQNKGFRTVRVYQNTDYEKEFLILGNEPGGRLVKKDIWWSPTHQNPTRSHSDGTVDSVILDKIPLDSIDIIDGNNLTNLDLYPHLNERLYLCYKMGKNIDPYKDLVFNREIPKEYQVAIDIISAGSNKEKKEILINTYFR